MNKEQMERVFAAGGVKPVDRVRLRDHDVFIGEGFSLPPHRIYRRFGVSETDFPRGMFATWWWIGKDEKLDTGQPLFFDTFHNPEYDAATKKIARKNTAIKEAVGFLNRRKAVHAIAS